MNNYKKYRFPLVILLLIFPSAIFAGDMSDLVNQLQGDFKDAVSLWYSPLKQIALWLLLSLTGIALFWSSAQILIQGGGLSEVVASMVRLILWTGFWMWYINNAQELNETLIRGWVLIGARATDQVFSIGAGEILESGLVMAKKIWEVSSWKTAVVYGPIAVLVVVLYTLIAAQAFFIVVEMYIVTAASVVILGFAGSPWTNDFAKKYLVYCMAVGMKLYVVFLVAGTGSAFVNNWAVNLEFGEMPSSFSLIALLIVVLILVKMIPDAVQGMITGASVGGATPSVGGMASGAAKMAGGAAMGAAGGAMLASEAVKAGKSAAGSSAGGSYRAANTLGAIAGAAKNVAAGRISGGMKQSSGSLMGSMAADIRAARSGNIDMVGDYGQGGSNGQAKPAKTQVGGGVGALGKNAGKSGSSGSIGS